MDLELMANLADILSCVIACSPFIILAYRQNKKGKKKRGNNLKVFAYLIIILIIIFSIFVTNRWEEQRTVPSSPESVQQGTDDDKLKPKLKK